MSSDEPGLGIKTVWKKKKEEKKSCRVMYVKSIVKNEKKKRRVVEMYGRLYFDMDV